MVETPYHSGFKNSWAQQTTKTTTKIYLYGEQKNAFYD